MRLRWLLRQLLAVMPYKLGDRTPRFCNFIVTKRCNSRCTFCNLWKSNDREELTLDQIKHIFNDPFLEELECFQLTGGEPFLRDDLAQLASFLSDKFASPPIWIPTNGILSDRIGEVAKWPENVGVTVSLDGRETIHNKTRGIKCYEKAIASLRRLLHRPMLTIGFTISRDNYKEIEFVYELSKDLGVDFSCRPVNLSDIYYENLDKDRWFPRSGLQFLSDFFRKIGKGKGPAETFYLDGIIKYLQNPDEMVLPCTALNNSFFLNKNGDVYPCLFFDVKLGNLLEQTMKEIWYLETVKKTRRLIKQGRCPNCWVECETNRNIAYYPEKVFL